MPHKAKRTPKGTVSFIINVTQGRINEANRRIERAQAGYHDPIDLAIKASAPGNILRKSVRVGRTAIEVATESARYIFDTTDEIKRFIDAFDSGKAVQPFKAALTFRLFKGVGNG